jgi:ketopantoate reductase
MFGRDFGRRNFFHRILRLISCATENAEFFLWFKLIAIGCLQYTTKTLQENYARIKKSRKNYNRRITDLCDAPVIVNQSKRVASQCR